MTTATSTGSTRGVCAVVAGGLVAGVGDLAFALVFYGFKGVAPGVILHSIAAGALGREAARAGGVATALLGVVLHFVIALTASAVFAAAARTRPVLLKGRGVPAGAIYGAGVWLVMNGVVLPLSATPPAAFPPPFWLPVLLAHIFLVGLPIGVASAVAWRGR